MRAVMPLRPEPLVPPDGADKHAGARQAATRVVATLRQDHPHLTCMVTADSLRAKAPPIATLHADGLRALLGVTAGDQASLFQHVPAAQHAGRGTYDARPDRAAGVVQRCRLVHAMPLHAAHTDVWVHGIAYGDRGENTVQHCSGVTD